MKAVLVTGGNKGIGFAICKTLLQENSDVHVILGARDISRGKKAVSSIVEQVGKDCIEFLQLDTSLEESVKEAARALEGRDLFGIVNNAGVGWGYSVKDTLEVNYYG